MLQWINGVLDSLGFVFYFFFFLVFSLFSIFLHRSRNMNAQVESADPALHPLTRLAKSIRQKKLTAAEKQKKTYSASKARRKKTTALLKKTDYLLYDKFKLLPDAHTGQNTNFFWLMFATVLVTASIAFVVGSDIVASLSYIRDTELGANPVSADILRRQLLLLILCTVSLALPCFLIKKNREFYLDVFTLDILLFVAIFKLISCARNGCCMGIPVSWGLYNSVLQTNTFPLQIVESITGGLLFALCVRFMLRSKHYRPGRATSAVLFSYAVPRFFWDFLRYHGTTYRFAESQIIFLGLSLMQIVCLGLVLLGIVWLFVLPLEKKLMDWLFEAITRHLPRHEQSNQTNAPELAPATKGDGKA